MVIETIGVDAPVGVYGLDANSIPQVPLNAAEVAWYDFSAQPGTGGNAVFAGHVTWSGRAVFYSLNQLVAGDTVRLRGEDGTELLYTVSDSFLVDPDDPNALAVMGPASADMITIISCDGDFYYTGDPVFRGDYTNRRVVQATLTSKNLVSAGEASSGS
jgi:LPXTG-site transpeptidase (sortase) family protein